ncbi:hypothetical protein ACUN0C_18805 [Faunimonas sp. B44]
MSAARMAMLEGRSAAASTVVMPGLDPGIQRGLDEEGPFWIAGSSPAMTTGGGAGVALRMLARRCDRE